MCVKRSKTFLFMLGDAKSQVTIQKVKKKMIKKYKIWFEIYVFLNLAIFVLTFWILPKFVIFEEIGKWHKKLKNDIYSKNSKRKKWSEPKIASSKNIHFASNLHFYIVFVLNIVLQNTIWISMESRSILRRTKKFWFGRDII